MHAIATTGKKISRGRRQESAGEARFRVGKAGRWTATTKSNDLATPMGLVASLAPEVWHKDTTSGGEVNVGRVPSATRSRFPGTKRALATRSAAGGRASWPGISPLEVALIEDVKCHGSLDKTCGGCQLSADGLWPERDSVSAASQTLINSARNLAARLALDASPCSG